MSAFVGSYLDCNLVCSKHKIRTQVAFAPRSRRQVAATRVELTEACQTLQLTSHAGLRLIVSSQFTVPAASEGAWQ